MSKALKTAAYIIAPLPTLAVDAWNHRSSIQKSLSNARQTITGQSTAKSASKPQDTVGQQAAQKSA